MPTGWDLFPVGAAASCQWVFLGAGGQLRWAFPTQAHVSQEPGARLRGNTFISSWKEPFGIVSESEPPHVQTVTV